MSSKNCVVKFNSSLTKILNLTEKLQKQLYGKVDIEFKSHRLKLSTAIKINFNVVINFLGPILEKHSEIIQNGELEKIMVLDFTQYGDDDKREQIEKNTIQSHQLLFIANNEQKEFLLEQVREMLAQYREFITYKK